LAPLSRNAYFYSNGLAEFGDWRRHVDNLLSMLTIAKFLKVSARAAPTGATFSKHDL
jgi:hypothetical protein